MIGGIIMWLVWYAATVGSLRALSLWSIWAPMDANVDRTPHTDL
jgi:hypothetical protein